MTEGGTYARAADDEARQSASTLTDAQQIVIGCRICRRLSAMCPAVGIQGGVERSETEHDRRACDWEKFGGGLSGCKADRNPDAGLRGAERIRGEKERLTKEFKEITPILYSQQ